MPKVSVIIPVYGVEKYIERCARSLFEQTLYDIEYLFIDDCTPDSSIKILKKVLEEYPNRKSQVIIHRMEQNSGQALVRKWGMQNATGDYVIHCDSDDWVELSMYESMLKQAEQLNSDIVVCNYKVVNSTDTIITNCIASTEHDTYLCQLFRLETPWSLCNKLVKRSLYQNVNFVFPTDNMGEDMLIMSQIVINSRSISFIEEAYYNYYNNDSSITKVKSIDATYKHWRQSCNNAEKLCDVLKIKGIDKKFSAEIIKLKYLQKKLAGPLARKREYAKVWLETFPEIHTRLWLSKNLALMDIVKFYITLFIAQINIIR